MLDKISTKVENFNNNDIKNGYAAVKWCIDHNLTQQGFTILQETIISEIVAKHFGENKITDKGKRELVSQAVNIRNNEILNKEILEENWKEPAKSKKDVVKKIVNGLDDNFVKIYDAVSQCRNDIDHAGFNDSPRKPEKIKEKLKECYDKLNQWRYENV